MRRGLFSLAILCLFSSCGGGGRYGYARTYVALPDEESHARRASETIYDEVRRMPEHFRGQTISWFGIVTGVTVEGALHRVAMQVRTHQDRHICEDETEASCRVTVSERDGGPFTAIVRLRGDDAGGENRIQPNSLVRVYGELLVGEYDSNGGPLVRTVYYRHWPVGQYFTTAARGSFRR